MYDFAIVGGGIVGLSTGMALYQRFPNAKVVVIEKEAVVAIIKRVITAASSIQEFIINQAVSKHGLPVKEANQ